MSEKLPVYQTERSGQAVPQPSANRLWYCDCCGAPMVSVSRFSWDECSAGCDTSACLMCVGDGMPRKLEILAEIVDLGEFWNEDRVVDRILRLGDLVKDAK
jgi:hypothetical protein